MKRLTSLVIVALSTVTVSCGSSSSDSAGETSASKSNFCKTFTDAKSAVDKLTDNLDSSTTDEETAKTDKEMMTIIRTLATEMIKNAPDEIKDEVALYSESLTKTFDLLESIDFDMTKAVSDPELAAKFDEISNVPGMTEAASAVDTYVNDTCGIDTSEGTSSDDTESSGDDFCQNARQYLSAMMSMGMLYDADTPDKDTVLFAYGSLASLARKMQASAPDTMKDQAKIISDRASGLVKYLKDADGDIGAALENPEFQQLDGDSASSDAMQQIQDSCGITMGDG